MTNSVFMILARMFVGAWMLCFLSILVLIPLVFIYGTWINPPRSTEWWILVLALPGLYLRWEEVMKLLWQRWKEVVHGT